MAYAMEFLDKHQSTYLRIIVGKLALSLEICFWEPFRRLENYRQTALRQI